VSKGTGSVGLALVLPGTIASMSLSLLLLFLHITTMVVAIAVAYGTGLVVRLAYMTGQVAAIRGVGMALARLEPVIPILFVAGGLFGLLTAINFGFDLLAPWLVIAYVLFAIAMVIGAAHTAKWGQRVGQVAASTPDGPLTPELAAMFTDRRVVALAIAEYAIVIVLIFDMVVKPLS
jgi:hypothetical protein